MSLMSVWGVDFSQEFDTFTLSFQSECSDRLAVQSAWKLMGVYIKLINAPYEKGESGVQV